MALMIVAIHTKAFHDIELIKKLTDPFLSAAVPVFFVLSFFFLFRKMNTKGFSWSIYKPFLKRLLILYAFWFIVTLPITIYTKWYYFDYSFPMFCIHFLKDLLFSYTFSGSWFLSALIIGTLTVFILKKYLKTPDFLLLFLAAVTFVYVKLHSILPIGLQRPYFFIQTYVRDVVELTPVTGFIWGSLGCVLAKGGYWEKLINNIGVWGSSISFVVMYLVFVLLPAELKFIITPFWVLSIILIFSVIRFKPSNIYLKFRNISILIYLIHFQVLNIAHFLPSETLHIYYYLLVLLVSVVFGIVIVTLEKCKCFAFLKYSH